MPVVCMVAPTVGVKRPQAQQRHVEMTPLRCHRQARHQRLSRFLPRQMLVLVLVLVLVQVWIRVHRALLGQA